jgi:hypothetical protein
MLALLMSAAYWKGLFVVRLSTLIGAVGEALLTVGWEELSATLLAVLTGAPRIEHKKENKGIVMLDRSRGQDACRCECECSVQVGSACQA